MDKCLSLAAPLCAMCVHSFGQHTLCIRNPSNYDNVIRNDNAGIMPKTIISAEVDVVVVSVHCVQRCHRTMVTFKSSVFVHTFVSMATQRHTHTRTHSSKSLYCHLAAIVAHIQAFRSNYNGPNRMQIHLKRIRNQCGQDQSFNI